MKAAQPGNSQEVLLHETAVSWIRYRESKNRTRKPWDESVLQFGTRMKALVQDINDNLDVDGLCKELPDRLQQVIDAEGDRISK